MMSLKVTSDMAEHIVVRDAPETEWALPVVHVQHLQHTLFECRGLWVSLDHQCHEVPVPLLIAAKEHIHFVLDLLDR